MWISDKLLTFVKTKLGLMKKTIKLICHSLLTVMVISTMLTSCGTSTFFTQTQVNELVAQIHQGTSQEEVKKLLGNPDNRRIIDGREIWQYTKVVLTNSNKIIEVGFENGIVQYLNTFDANTSHQQ